METLKYDELEGCIVDIETIDDVKRVLLDISDFVYSIEGINKEGGN